MIVMPFPWLSPCAMRHAPSGPSSFTPVSICHWYAATGLIYMATWVLYKEGSKVAPFLAASVPGALALQVAVVSEPE